MLAEPFNINNLESSLNEELKILFKDKIQAFSFLCFYLDYVHMVDDLVDEVKNVELIRQCSKQAAIVFNCDYWINHQRELYLVDRITHNTYFDAVKWEHSEEEWKRRDARALNHCGYNMLFAVILIEFGEQKLQDVSIKFREFSHAKHLGDKIYDRKT